MGRVDGKVAFITGAGRGQGRAHAVKLASEGADIVAMDICDDLDWIRYPMATKEDLAETARLVEQQGRQVIAQPGDVRNPADVEAVVARGLSEFGHIDVVVANAGVLNFVPSWEISEAEWTETVSTMLSGPWRTAKAVIPSMIERGRGGSIIFTSSGAAMRAIGNLAHYASCKSGLLGLCREMALELGPHGIRVNTLHPTAVGTRMLDNEAVGGVFSPGTTFASDDERRRVMDETIKRDLNMLPVGWSAPEEVSEAVLFLASDESRLVTATPFRIDAGFASK